MLSFIKDTDKDIILLGANGSGKSSFANFLKNSNIGSLTVLPAQRNLYLNSDSYVKLSEASVDLTSIQQEQNQRSFKGYDDSSIKEFNKVITAYVNNHVIESSSFYTGNQPEISFKESKIGNLFAIFNKLIPNITFEINTSIRTIYPTINGNSYHFNELSDGERAIVYYISHTLVADENSTIIIDEPEIYINASLYKSLWDILIAKRPDCQFIFITHSFDFIASRDSESTKLLWIKNFNPPVNWTIENLPNINDIPVHLIAELASSRKPILFCEGELSGFDYKLYSLLFSSKYNVQPVGNHLSVIQYTRAINKQINMVNAIGIIDRDQNEQEQINTYKKDKIYTLPFNEIEMLLLYESLMKKVLENCCDNPDDKIKRFKENFFKEVTNKKDRIITAAIKKYMDTEISNYRIQSFGSVTG